MNTLDFVLILVVFSAGVSCQQKIDVEKEKAAIIGVIKEETDAFYDRDYERLVACHVLDGSNIRLTASKAGFNYTVGWEDSGLKKFIENDLDLSKEVKSNFKIKVYPKSAWAAYDNEYYNEDGELTNTGIHVQFLEKRAGAWKIVYLSIISAGSYTNVEFESMHFKRFENGKIAEIWEYGDSKQVD